MNTQGHEAYKKKTVTADGLFYLGRLFFKRCNGTG